MIKKNPHEKNIQKQCDVCGNIVYVDQFGGGICNNCGWIQDSASKERTDIPTSIIISLNKARQLYKEGKPFKVDFDDFINAFMFYGEMEFYYNKICYGICWTGEGDGVRFWASDVPIKERVTIEFASPEDFIANARIDGILIKDLWDKVENPYYLQ